MESVTEHGNTFSLCGLVALAAQQALEVCRGLFQWVHYLGYYFLIFFIFNKEQYLLLVEKAIHVFKKRAHACNA